ncbi:hypothetical protein [Rossellomorea aquimaris]|uniref:hypothetical protein n=1 Tax=Rossellomorea aquimaris TaxID=189382 RepID=UPI0007D0B3F9|nr:hypothetical protein [Rossellomorea aquimaris]
MTKTEANRKDVIVKEIHFWKQNNMLPEHYCNYLLALYTEGEESAGSESPAKSKTRLKLTGSIIAILLMFISLFVIYFTELSIVLQTAILAGFVGFLLVMVIYYTKKQLPAALPFIASAFILLNISIEITEKVYNGAPFPTYLALFLNIFLWLLVGYKFKLIYFSLSGVIGFLLLVIFILQ